MNASIEKKLCVSSAPSDRANLWRLSLDGGEPERLTDFNDLRLFNVAFSPDGETVAFARGQVGTTVRVNLEADEAGPRSYRFAIEPDPREHVAENNARTLLLTVEDRREKILYFEGEPRFEVRFLRQAVQQALVAAREIPRPEVLQPGELAGTRQQRLGFEGAPARAQRLRQPQGGIEPPHTQGQSGGFQHRIGISHPLPRATRQRRAAAQT